MFVRWNDTLNIYEYDTSVEQNGVGPWVQLPNIPYKDQSNTFTNAQTFKSAFPFFLFHCEAEAAERKQTRFEGFGNFYISHVNDANSAYIKRFIFGRDGNVTIPGVILERGRVEALGQWTDYTPVWQNYGGFLPTIGNGSLTGRYMLIGNTVFFSMRIIVGTTTNFGTGLFSFTLPAAPNNLANIEINGSGYVWGSHGVAFNIQVMPAAYYFGINNAIGFFVRTTNPYDSYLSSDSPLTPAQWPGSFIQVSGMYYL